MKLSNLQNRVGYYGETVRIKSNGSTAPAGTKGTFKSIRPIQDQWTRMREGKLRSLKRALHYSYQAAIVQVYNPNESEYAQSAPYFRCLINHDKLKVAYEDKIISIPFEENSCNINFSSDTITPVIDNNDLKETGFSNGTVFKWVHGNKSDWIQDSYWIVYLQYSEETAYFRAEIRKADDYITIIPIEEDGSEGDPLYYHGWSSGPDETQAMWNTKNNVSWNDLNYTKELFITKDENTQAYFRRFDRIIINGTPWEVQAYNDNYGSSSSNNDTGIIRVALKETYTSTAQQLENYEENISEQIENTNIIGASYLSPYESFTYTIDTNEDGEWSIYLKTEDNLSDILSYEIKDKSITVTVLTKKSYKDGFYLKYGSSEEKQIIIKA